MKRLVETAPQTRAGARAVLAYVAEPVRGSLGQPWDAETTEALLEGLASSPALQDRCVQSNLSNGELCRGLRGRRGADGVARPAAGDGRRLARLCTLSRGAPALLNVAYVCRAQPRSRLSLSKARLGSQAPAHDAACYGSTLPDFVPTL